MAGHNTGTNTQKDPQLVGEPAEVDMLVNGVKTTGLCDTGSCISCCSESFFETNFQKSELKPIDEFLRIETASGHSLPYKGYIEANIQVSGIARSKQQVCLLLVVPNTAYNNRVPILLGTNVLSLLLTDCRDTHGERFLQKGKLATPFALAFRCMVIRDKDLKRNHDRLAILKCALTQSVSIGPNQSIDITCTTDKEINHLSTAAIVQETETSSLPKFVDIGPAVVRYEYGKNSNITVNLSNLTSNVVTISPKEIIGELQPVTVDNSGIDQIEVEEPEVDPLQQITIGTDVTNTQKKKLDQVLKKHKGIFSTGDTDIGQCNLYKHRIELSDPTPFKQRHRRIPPAMIDEVRTHLADLLTSGIIRKSKSPWASAVVLVRRKNGRLRLCVDYRMLNQRSVKDSYALPRVEEVFDCLHGSQWFSTIDMKSGYYQVEIEEDHKERTAFTVGSLGFYEFNKLAFGLSNSPATYQRLMEECLGEYNMKICIIYLDDIIIFSNSFEEHLERLNLVMTRLQECGIKLNAEKCFLMKKSVNFLGHVVSSEGVATDPSKIEKIKNYPKPANADELRSFIAFAGYYRKYLPNYSRLAKPLTELLPPTSEKKLKKKKSQKSWKWEEEHEATFQKIKELLTSPPILAYPNFNEPFILHTDASTQGLGAVLYQIQENKKKVIAYASRGLSKSEKNYSAFKLEFLALKWAITEKFSDYLVSQTFTVYTDNNPLTHILSSAKLEATGQRWVAALSDYNFSIVYRPGVNAADADTMSRYPTRLLEEDSRQIEVDTVKAICNTIHTNPFIEILPSQSVNVLDAMDNPYQPMAQLELQEIRRKQREDPIIGLWLRATIDNKLPNRRDIQNNPKHQTMSRIFSHLIVKRGILYREVTEKEETIKQLVLPEVFRKQVLVGLHNEMGHPGKERTVSLVRERFYWPGYTIECEKHVSNCDRCLRRKTPTNSRAPMVNIKSSYPLEVVCMDYLTVDPCKGNIHNVLVVTDHFTKYAIAIATRNQTAKTTAEALLDNFILHYGIPTKIHSDQGANFESEIIKQLCTLMNIEKTRTSVYHPQCNGISERYNRTLLSMLGTLELDKKADWKKHLPTLVFAYNATKHESTGFSPFELMFGRKAKLPVDATFRLQDEEEVSRDTNEYITELKDRLETARSIAEKTLEKARDKQKAGYDKKAKAVKLAIGDKVLVKILAFKGKHKIADKFETEVYTVTDQVNKDIPVFVVKSPSGKSKSLHRNHLFPVAADLDSDSSREPAPKPKPVPRPRRRKEVIEVVPEVTTESTNESSSDSESDVEPVRHREFNVTRRKTVETHGTDTASADIESRAEPVIDTEPKDNGAIEAQRRDSIPENIETVEEQEKDSTTDEENEEDAVNSSRNQAEAQGRATSPVERRRSSRPKRKPIWYDSYQVGQQSINRLIQLQADQTKITAQLVNTLTQK